MKKTICDMCGDDIEDNEGSFPYRELTFCTMGGFPHESYDLCKDCYEALKRKLA